MDPTGPSQPPLDTAYETAGNPASQNPQEQSNAQVNDSSNTGSLVDSREQGDIPVPSAHSGGGVPSSLGYGSRTGAGDSTSGEAGLSNTDAEQMAAPGEGEIAAAQDKKTGFGEQKDLASDLDRKKAEQAGAREQVKDMRSSGTDVGGDLGQTGGPAVVEGR